MYGLYRSENTDSVKELVLRQEDAPAPEIHRTVPHFEHKMALLSAPTT